MDIGACILWIYSLFIDLRVPSKHPVVYELAAGALFFHKKHAPGFWKCILWMLSFSAILGSPGKMFKIWSICSNDYASKTRIEILCVLDCSPFLSQSDFLGNSW